MCIMRSFLYSSHGNGSAKLSTTASSISHAIQMKCWSTVEMDPKRIHSFHSRLNLGCMSWNTLNRRVASEQKFCKNTPWTNVFPIIRWPRMKTNINGRIPHMGNKLPERGKKSKANQNKTKQTHSTKTTSKICFDLKSIAHLIENIF